MRAVAVIPAGGLLAGSAAGLLVPEVTSIFGHVAVAAALAWTVWSWKASGQWSIVAAVALTFFSGGALLAADAWHKAWRPPLRLLFEQLAGERRREAEALGQALPDEDSVFAVADRGAACGCLRSSQRRGPQPRRSVRGRPPDAPSRDPFSCRGREPGIARFDRGRGRSSCPRRRPAQCRRYACGRAHRQMARGPRHPRAGGASSSFSLPESGRRG